MYNYPICIEKSGKMWYNNINTRRSDTGGDLMNKKQFFTSIITAVMTFTFATAAAITANAGSASGVTGKYAEYDLKGLDPNNAETKPTLAVSRIELPINEAMENPVQHIEITVTGAELKYAATGLHIGYDERLTLQLNRFGKPAKTGDASELLAKDQSVGLENDFFLTTCCSEDLGLDGVLWSFDFTLPVDLNVGDEFPIEILYRLAGDTGDLFASVLDDKASKLMEAWVFTKGIEQGYIKITEAVEEPEIIEEPEAIEEPKTVEEPEEEILIGDINGDTVINANDASLILSSYSKLQVGAELDLTPEQMKAADINGDGKIDAKDASDALAYYSYLSTGGTATFAEFLAAK